jgi:glutamate synthase (NADPH/NADH) large chain
MADLEPLGADDSGYLRELIGRYHASTGSAVASGLLDDWDDTVRRLRRVMPRDYKRVLAATKNVGESATGTGAEAIRNG